MLLRLQLLVFAICKDLLREECINPEKIKLDELFCKDVSEQLPNTEIQGSS